MTVELPESFEWRYNQREFVSKIRKKLQDNHIVAFQAPTNWGKTIVANYVGLTQPLPVTYLSSTYASVREVIKTLEILGQRENLSIILPKGMRKVRENVCQERTCSGCPKIKKKIPHLNNRDFKGRVIDDKWIKQQYPSLCPYKFLIEASKVGDWVITHYKMLKDPIRGGGNLETRGFLIVDEVDEALKPTDVLLAKYSIVNQHLETSREGKILNQAMDTVNELKDKYSPFNRLNSETENQIFLEWCEEFMDILKMIDEEFNKNPIEFEKQNIEEIGTESADIHIALSTAAYQLYQTTKLWKKLLERGHFLRITKHLLEFYREDFLKRLRPEEKHFLQELLYCLTHAKDFYPKRVGWSHVEKCGYFEIWLVTGKSNLQEITSHYEKRLFISATFPSNMSEDISLVKCETDPYGAKKMVILVPSAYIKTGVKKRLLEKCNLLGVTTSIHRAKEAKHRYGGEIIGRKTDLLEVARNCRIRKGNLYWIYYGNIHGRSTNLLRVFDGVIFQDYLDKSDPLTLGVNEQYRENCVKKLYQLASRVFRTGENGKHRVRFILTDNREAVRLLRREVPNWNYIPPGETQHKKDVVEIVLKHAELLPVKERLKPVKFKPINKDGKIFFVGKASKEHLEEFGEGFTLSDDDFWKIRKKESLLL